MTFWKTVWATLVGNIIASIIGTILTVVVIAAIIGALSSSDGVSMENESILKIKLENSFTERGLDTPSFNLDGAEDRIALRDLERVLHFAKSDERIEGVYLNIGAIQAAPAMLLEMHNAILEFKTSGKWVIAYSEGYSSGEFYKTLNLSADLKWRFGSNGYGAPSIRKQQPVVMPIIQGLSTTPANRDVRVHDAVI